MQGIRVGFLAPTGFTAFGKAVQPISGPPLLNLYRLILLMEYLPPNYTATSKAGSKFLLLPPVPTSYLDGLLRRHSMSD